MDEQNARAIEKICPSVHRSKIVKITDFDDTTSGSNIEDPYHGDKEAFKVAFDRLFFLCQKAFDSIN